MSPVAGDKDGVEAPVVVEWRSGFSNPTSFKEYRLDQLVYTLRQMHIAENSTESSPAAPVNFSMLYREGWITTDPSFTSIGLVYKFLQDRRQDPPALDLRFAMALALAQSLANMVTVGWMHKAVRSHNVLVFDKENLSELFLAGFTYMRSGDAEREDLSTLPCHDPTFQLYRPSLQQARPPDQGTTTERSRLQALRNTRFDTFGLGIVMLEVGLWKIVDSLAEPLADKMSAQEFLTSKELRSWIARLSSRMGDTYCNAVKACIDFGRGSVQQKDEKTSSKNSL
ncbi:uncharacterized protein Z518_00245 [Rhinocladiella mackenziei CBS 650.93]|uniref:Protein kinase domain-containing protein n=1 Tax=Rhinocladiella mackenziei CBS 650.93 TaxID=1442369 RepID=A0A0D2J0H9_9EURO|nr:uncharacterized protein Z518_00245 [Rhinocladiella mackenziei CBS 650.93]KIX09166.1 hypothetical protein Z518_00245 [Rhinocladiella mackenziei CBS 650.93]